MSIHPSFKSGKSKIQKSVLKRLEKILRLRKEEKWDEKKDSVFGLPKVKVTKLKLKKEKKEAVPVEGAEGAVAAPAGTEATKAAEKKPSDKKSPEKKSSDEKK